jgi:hypothetical protein
VRAGGGGVVLAPAADEVVTLREGDTVLVIAENF